MKKIVNGDVFIIPNEVVKISELLPSSREAAMRRLKTFGFEAENETLLVQVWATGEKSDNWSCHSWLDEFMTESEIEKYYDCKLPELRIERFPSYLPTQLFKNKSEGDQVVLHTQSEDLLPNGLTINLTLNQLGYRYRHFGRFESVLNRLMRVHS